MFGDHLIHLMFILTDMIFGMIGHLIVKLKKMQGRIGIVYLESYKVNTNLLFTIY